MSEIRVSPTELDPTHHLSLSDGTNTLGLVLSNGAGAQDPRALKRVQAQRTPLKTHQGSPRWSDYELPWASVIQNDWSGGRGSEDLDRQAARYYDGHRINTVHENQLILGGLETYATGYRNQELHMPGNVTWWSPFGNSRFLAASFVASATYTANKVEIPIRRVGTPGTLTGAIYTNVAGAPGAYIGYGTITVGTVTDTLALLQQFSLAPTVDLIQGTTYWVVIYAPVTDDAFNHWEVGGDTNTGMYSGDGTTWTSLASKIYFRVTDPDSFFTPIFFDYKGQVYFATKPEDGSAGKVYMNGWRGLADNNGGLLYKLIDGTQTGWASENMVGLIAQITDGSGSQEEQNWRTIYGQGSGYVSVSPDWYIVHLAENQDATQYVIINSDKFFLQQTGIAAFTDVAVTGEMAFLASGEKRNGNRPIYKMREYSDYTQWVKNWQAESLIQATFLQAIPHPTLGYILWLANNNDTGESTTLTRTPAPRDQNQQLVVSYAYHSTTAAGFMREQTTSPYASDSLNRADGALGNTDGAGHTVAYPFAAGGSGIAWVEFTGTWGVVGNKAKASALATAKALAGFAPSGNNVTLRAAVTRSGGQAGIFVRRADDNNYIFCYHNGTNLVLVKRVGGTNTNVFSNAVTYVAGAELEIRCNLTKFTVKYNGVQVDTEQVIGDAGLQSGAGVGVYTDDITNTFDNVYVYTTPVVVTVTGSNSGKIDVPASFTTGLIASDQVKDSGEDWRRFSRLKLTIKSTKAMAAGELQLLIDDNLLCGSPIKTVSFPALAAGATYGFRPLYVNTVEIEFDLSATTGADLVRSVGLNLTVDPADDFSLYVSFRWLTPDVDVIPVGDNTDPFTGLERYGDPETLWALKQASIWQIENDIPTKIPLREMEAVKSGLNGRAHVVNDVYLYYSLLNSLERYFRQNVDDVGPNRDAGLPIGRQGHISHMVGYPGRIYVAINGGPDAISSVLCFTGTGYHEVYRAPRAGLPIRRLHIQPIPSNAPDRLWIGMGGDVLWIPLPSNNFNPYYDYNYPYHYESSIVLSWMYAGMEDIVKLFKSVKLFTEGLSSSQSIDLYYQTDQATTWTRVATAFTQSPVQEIALSATNNVSGKRIRLRLVLKTTDRGKTPKVTAVVLESLARIPVKQQYTFEFNISDGLLELTEKDPDDTTFRAENIIAQLDTWTANLTALTMRSVFSPYDNKTVMVSSFGVNPLKVIYDDQVEQHIAQMEVVEL